MAARISMRPGAERAAHSHEHFRLAIESAPTGMLMVDESGNIVLVNAQVERLFGYPREEMIGQPVEMLVPLRFREKHPYHLKRFFEDPHARAMGACRDLFGLRKDGSEVPIEIGLTPLHTPDGYFVLSSIADITERIHAAEHFRLAIEAAPTGMLMVNAGGDIVLVNAQVETLFGYAREELIGRPLEMLVPERFRSKHPQHLTQFFHEPQARSMGAGRDLFGLRKNGTELPIEIGLNPLTTREGSFVLSSIVDITDRKRAEERLAESLREKEVLLKEIHHRVKNNLQIISSLLNLQSHHVDDERTRSVFAQSQARIHSIALVHEKLYQAADLNRIRFSDYLRELTDHLVHAQGGEQRNIECVVVDSDLQLRTDTCIACGLVVNELVTNSIKHAFVDRAAGRIVVSLASHEGELTLTVADDGNGLPPDFDLRCVTSLGLDLVTTFAHRLKAAIHVNREHGTQFLLRFTER